MLDSKSIWEYEQTREYYVGFFLNYYGVYPTEVDYYHSIDCISVEVREFGIVYQGSIHQDNSAMYGHNLYSSVFHRIPGSVNITSVFKVGMWAYETY